MAGCSFVRSMFFWKKTVIETDHRTARAFALFRLIRSFFSPEVNACCITYDPSPALCVAQKGDITLAHVNTDA